MLRNKDFPTSLFILICLFCTHLAACNEHEAKDSQIASSQQEVKPETNIISEPPSEIDKEKANKILGFYNKSIEEFNSGYFSLPKKIYQHRQYYLTHWQLPEKLKIPTKNKRAFQPPKGIFTTQDEKNLAEAYDKMDSTLDQMIGDYHKLEAYITDSTIQDDGKEGKNLTDLLMSGNTKFMAARKSWLGIVEAEAAKAENTMLRDDPLSRQIIAAHNILRLINETADLFISGELQRQNLGMTIQDLELNIENGNKPPFPAASRLERLYKAFIKAALNYTNVLKKCELEGIFQVQMRELTKAAHLCQTAYNAFAQARNSTSSQLVISFAKEIKSAAIFLASSYLSI